MTIDEAEKIRKVVENKDYIAQLVNAVEKKLIEAFDNLKIEDVNMFQLGYNKAIDDFVNACEKQFTTMYGQRYVDMRDIVNIAEQLKEGGNNE